MNEFEKFREDVYAVDYLTKTDKILNEIKSILEKIQIPSRYLIAEGLDDLYQEVKR